MKLYQPGEPWEHYPPTTEDKARIEWYEKAKLLRKGKHQEVFDMTGFSETADLKYLVVNFCSLISLVSADLLFGEDIELKSVSKNKDVDSAIAEITKRSNLQNRLWRSAFSSSGRGDAVIKVNYVEGKGAVIKTVPAQYYFPHWEYDDITELTGATIASVIEDAKSRKILLREIHTPGQIVNEKWLMEAGKFELISQDAPIQTGYDGLLVFHVPNYCGDDEFWGESDYSPLMPLQGAFNSAITRFDSTLNKYSDPMLAVPKGTLKRIEDAIQSGDASEFVKAFVAQSDLLYNRKRSQVFEGSPDQLGDLPRYVSWDADLTSRISEIAELYKAIMMVTETSPSLFGIEEGGLPESGRAMKFRFFRTLSMINRKSQFWDPAICAAVRAALCLEHVHDKGVEPEDPSLTWADGLPADEQEKVGIAAQKKSAGLASKKRLVGEANEIQGEELEKEVKAIEEEEKAVEERYKVGNPE